MRPRTGQDWQTRHPLAQETGWFRASPRRAPMVRPFLDRFVSHRPNSPNPSPPAPGHCPKYA